MINVVGMTNMLDQNGLMKQVGVQMLDKTLENEQQKSNDLVKMMEQSVQPNLGKNIDVSL